VLGFVAVKPLERAADWVLTPEAVVGPVMFLGYNHSLALSESIPRTLQT